MTCTLYTGHHILKYPQYVIDSDFNLALPFRTGRRSNLPPGNPTLGLVVSATRSCSECITEESPCSEMSPCFEICWAVRTNMRPHPPLSTLGGAPTASHDSWFRFPLGLIFMYMCVLHLLNAHPYHVLKANLLKTMTYGMCLMHV